MRIVFNFFSPGVTDDNFMTGATGANWLPQLFHYLETHGHSVHNVSVGLMKGNEDVYENVMTVRPNLIVLIWRWPMPNYPQRHAAYERQSKLLQYAAKNRVPVLIHDEDLQSGALEAAASLTVSGTPVKITAPMIYPFSGYETLMFPWFGDPQPSVEKTVDLMYIGNNYSRLEQTVRYLANPFWANKTVHVYGNWLDPSPDRPSPEEIRSLMPNVQFKGRLDQRDVNKTLSTAVMTIHLATKEYCRSGFLTLRWAEAATAGTVAMVPLEFVLPESMTSQYKYLNFENLKRNGYAYHELLRKQREFVNRVFSPKRWLQRIEELGQWS